MGSHWRKSRRVFSHPVVWLGFAVSGSVPKHVTEYLKQNSEWCVCVYIYIYIVDQERKTLFATFLLHQQLAPPPPLWSGIRKG
jgi:hypothetical protein